MAKSYITKNFRGLFGPDGYELKNTPEAYGMRRDDEKPEHYNIEMTKKNIKKVHEVIDQQYDLLGYPPKGRVYHVKDHDALKSYFRIMDSYVFTRDKPSRSAKAYRSKAGGSDKFYERFRGAILAKYRLYMGIVIYSELKNQGGCEMRVPKPAAQQAGPGKAAQKEKTREKAE